MTYTGTGVARTVPHGLGKIPTLIIVKCLTTAQSWVCYFPALGATRAVFLDLTSAAVTNTGYWNDTAPTSTQFTVGNFSNVNALGDDYVAYIFTDSSIFKVFSYIGNGNADGPFVNLGARPLSIPLFKDVDATVGWYNFDSARNPFNLITRFAQPNVNSAETTGSGSWSFHSNGFKLQQSAASLNANGNLHIGLAILESTKYTNAY